MRAAMTGSRAKSLAGSGERWAEALAPANPRTRQQRTPAGLVLPRHRLLVPRDSSPGFARPTVRAAVTLVGTFHWSYVVKHLPAPDRICLCQLLRVTHTPLWRSSPAYRTAQLSQAAWPSPLRLGKATHPGAALGYLGAALGRGDPKAMQR